MSEVLISTSAVAESAGCCGCDCCGGAAAVDHSGRADILLAVQERYGAIATDVLSGARSSCCGDGCCDHTPGDQFRRTCTG